MRGVRDDEGHKVSEKCRLEDRGGNLSGSQRRQPARLAWLECLGAHPKPHLVLLAPRQLPELDV